jgi:hypothetical protein
MKISLTSLFIVLLLKGCMYSDSQIKQSNDSTQTELHDRTSFIRDSTCTVDSLDIVFYIPENCIAEITNTRPLKTDSNVVLCCAAAFTRLENDAIDGLFVMKGKPVITKVNRGLGGGITIPHDGNVLKCFIQGTEMGSKLDTVFIAKIIADSSSFFQQIQLNRDGLPLVFRKDVSRFQRRAVCILNRKAVIAESKYACTLQEFANALDSAGIDNSIYLDMGSWDEGWFRRKSGKIETIGLLRTATRRQSNWFVFRSQP